MPALALPTIAKGAEPDPIFAAIEAHRTAWRRCIGAMNAKAETEAALSDEHGHGWTEFSRSRAYGDELTIVKTDDPRFIAAITDTHKTCLAADAAAEAILDTTPTTVAGVDAALAYCYEHGCELDGHGWPEAGYADPWHPERKTPPLWDGLSFYQFMAKHLSDALADIVAAS